MKRNKKEAGQTKKTLLSLFYITVLLCYVYAVFSLPAAPNIDPISNSTSNSSGIGTIRSGDDGGYVYTVNLDAVQQNVGWKAYVGNVTGKLVLEDSGSYSIYEWDLGISSDGKVFISRNGSVDWATVNCSNRSVIEAEDTLLGKAAAASDSINNTFNYTIHRSFTVASTINIVNSTCPSLVTYVNDSAQTISESADFQEVLLADNNGNGNLIYTTVMEQDVYGYKNDNGTTYDFQALVADEEGGGGAKTTYYFYVELGI
ncbi:hypothetical protein GOV05_01515 [Candidatus Woesearchaeota archaeon]|nr:hypothetical protein [Candidatus Woesearchaeota archaeon]